MGKPERHPWFQEHWNILSNVLFRRAADEKKMPMFWKSLNCWSCKSEKSKRAKKLMPLYYPSQTFLQTWKVVSYCQQQYHPGYIPKQWKSSYVSNRNSYNNSQEQVGKFFFKVYHNSLEDVLIMGKSDGDIWGGIPIDKLCECYNLYRQFLVIVCWVCKWGNRCGHQGSVDNDNWHLDRWVRPQESDQGCYWYKGNLIFFRQIKWDGFFFSPEDVEWCFIFFF